MAERRMVSKVISISEKVNSMSLFGRLLYTWMIPHADDFGRMPGSPMKVRALVVPMGDETSKDVESALSEMQDRGLINWYEIAGERYIQISNFDEHQQGLHKRSLSKFPAPPNEGKQADDAQYGERLSASEADIEEMVCDATEQNEFIEGDRIFQVERQVRVSNSYLDIVATGERQKYILEIKRQRLSNAALEQIIRYRELLGNKARCLLVGYGLSANFDMKKAKEERVNVIVYDDSLTLEQLLLTDVNCREITLPIETNGIRTGTEENRKIDGLIAREEPETFYQAHSRVFGFECNPLQAQKLIVYIEQDGLEETVIVRAIERAAEYGKAGYNFKLITGILDNYFKSGVRTLMQAEQLDAAFDAKKGLSPTKTDPELESRRIEIARNKWISEGNDPDEFNYAASCDRSRTSRIRSGVP